MTISKNNEIGKKTGRAISKKTKRLIKNKKGSYKSNKINTKHFPTS